MDFIGELEKWHGHDPLFLRHLWILELLERYGETKGKHTVVIGRILWVNEYFDEKGFPGTLQLPTHSYTKNIEEITVQADIIITALGVLTI
jgi:methylenetetrahydrofolate dehydrogenase (NADP+)/methenyltetrahydrofolate cyclohydrolase